MSNTVKKNVVFTYGRMNPPHSGHIKLIQEIKNLANKEGKKPIVILSHKEGTKENPLLLENKIKILEQILKKKGLSKVEINHTTPKRLIQFTMNEFSPNSIMVLGENRIENGQFKFLKFNTRSVKRNKKTSASATKARAAAVSGKKEAFNKITNYGNNKLTNNVFEKLRSVLVKNSKTPNYPTSPPISKSKRKSPRTTTTNSGRKTPRTTRSKRKPPRTTTTNSERNTPRPNIGTFI